MWAMRFEPAEQPYSNSSYFIVLNESSYFRYFAWRSVTVEGLQCRQPLFKIKHFFDNRYICNRPSNDQMIQIHINGCDARDQKFAIRVILAIWLESF